LDWVRGTLGRRDFAEKAIETELSLVTDTLHSTLLPVHRLPMTVYAAPPSTTDTSEIKKHLLWHAPYILHGGQLFTFEDLRRPKNAFDNIINWRQASKMDAPALWDDPDSYRMYVYLLGRCLNKITGSRGLMLDKKHGRFFFAQEKPGEPKKIRYRPLNMESTELSVVWQPIQKSTGRPYGHWLHRAIRLRFFRIATRSWVLAMRPEFRVTEDGVKEYNASETGAKVTHQKARMYNINLLTEVNFWRHFLSDGAPRIVYCCGRQSLVIGTTLQQATLTWPGVPGDAIAFRNVQIPETLLSLAQSEDAIADEADSEDAWLLEEDSVEDIADE
jgi:hypothetical protein